MKKAKFLVETEDVSLKVYRVDDGVNIVMDDRGDILDIWLDYYELLDLENYLQSIRWDIGEEKKKSEA